MFDEYTTAWEESDFAADSFWLRENEELTEAMQEEDFNFTCLHQAVEVLQIMGLQFGDEALNKAGKDAIAAIDKFCYIYSDLAGV